MISPIVIAAAQISSVRGDLHSNVRHHAEFIETAASHHVDLIVFPELSLTGYEPDIAAEIALLGNEPALQLLQQLADQHSMTILAGCPIASGQPKPHIGAFAFSPGSKLTPYRKRFLDPDEFSHFVGSDDIVVISALEHRVGMVICADISNPQHPRDLAERGISIYAAGVAMTPRGIDQAESNLSLYSKQFGFISIMANYASTTGGYEIAGRSGVWDAQGNCLIRTQGAGEMLVIAELNAHASRGHLIEMSA